MPRLEHPMPPDPILALLCFVGLFVYAVIGGVVGAFGLRVLSPSTYHAYLAGRRSYSYTGEVWASLAAIAFFWPLVVTLSLPVLLLLGPWMITKRVAMYTSKSQLVEST